MLDGDPDTECGGKAVGWFHISPDCTHHSQAAGGQPRKREIQNLSWIGLKWAGKKMPRVISLKNVKPILQWGPLIAKRCKVTGRVVKLGGDIAAPRRGGSGSPAILGPRPAAPRAYMGGVRCRTEAPGPCRGVARNQGMRLRPPNQLGMPVHDRPVRWAADHVARANPHEEPGQGPAEVEDRRQLHRLQQPRQEHLHPQERLGPDHPAPRCKRQDEVRH